MTLAKKAVHGIAWVTLSTIIVRFLGFGTQIVLARLLDPSDFGLLAIGLLAINAMGLFRELGFGAALIYKKDDSNHTAANTAFLLLPVVASILFVLAYLSAPYVAVFFDNATVEPIIRILSLTFVISSFGTVPSLLLEKELEFKKKVLPETVPVVGYACVAIGLALLGYGVWSLVYGLIVSAVLTAVLIWMVSDWRPTFSFDKKVAKELFGYGKHILGASVVIFLGTNIDNAIVGKMLGMSALGFYTIAYTISNLPATQITHLVGRVMFPTYSKLQDDRDALRNAYLKTLKYVSMLSIPAAFGIMVIAPDFVSVVLGEKWMPCVPALQVLCVFGLIRSLGATTGSVLQAVGNPKYLRNISILSLIVLLVILYPLTKSLDILGTGIAIVFSGLIGSLMGLNKMRSILNFKIVDYVKIFKPTFFAITVSLFSVIVSKQFVCSGTVTSLITLFGAFSLCYILSLYFFDRKILAELKQIIYLKF